MKEIKRNEKKRSIDLRDKETYRQLESFGSSSISCSIAQKRIRIDISCGNKTVPRPKQNNTKKRGGKEKEKQTNELQKDKENTLFRKKNFS